MQKSNPSSYKKLIVFTLGVSTFFALLLSCLNWYITGYSLFLSLTSADFYILLAIVFFGLTVKKRIWQSVYFGFFGFLFLIEMIHWRYFGGPLVPGEIYKFFVDFNEVTQSVGSDTAKRFIFPIASIVLLIFGFIFVVKQYKERFLKISYIAWLPLFAMGMLSFNARESTNLLQSFSPEQHLIRSGMEVISVFFGNYLPYKLSDQSKSEVADKPVPASIAESNASIVLIVGESATSVRMSVFDYFINTTPNLLALKQQKKIVAKKSIAQASCTDVSLLSFFNLLDSINQTQTVLNGNHLLFKLAKNRGYKTHFITAQSSDGATNYAGQMNKNFIDVYRTSKDIDPSKGSDEACMDNVLLDELKKIDFNSGKQFVVFQLYGSHEQYNERYPKAFEKFQKINYPYPQNAAYDNSLLYTDYLLKEMLTHIESNNKQPLYFFYMSDHGECQGEEGEDIFGHLMFRRNVAATPLVMAKFNIANDTVIPRIMNYPYVYSNYFLALEIARLLGYDYRYKPQNYYLINGVDLGGRDGFARVYVNDSTITDIR
jgi:glucan phosphoethanolaminetransferase (alkaline phosphatase superfamily)